MKLIGYKTVNKRRQSDQLFTTQKNGRLLRALCEFSMMKYIVSFVTYSSFASDNLCRSIESGGEGHWPIKESAFNLKNANEALSNLKHYMNNPESEVALEAENDWVIIKGYLLKEPALKGHVMDVKDFCNFIEQEAYVRH